MGTNLWVMDRPARALTGRAGGLRAGSPPVYGLGHRGCEAVRLKPDIAHRVTIKKRLSVLMEFSPMHTRDQIRLTTLAGSAG